MKNFANKDLISTQDIRDEFISRLDKGNLDYQDSVFAQQLFNCGLTVYSRNYSFDSAIYQAFSLSVLNKNISLHPEQLRVLREIEDNPAVIISAPTSFGKTFCIFNTSLESIQKMLCWLSLPLH